MNNTKIEWADMTWSPVTGCLHNCPYCYARKIAKRFGGAYDRLLGGNKIFAPYETVAEYSGGVVHTEMQRMEKNGKLVKAAYPCGFAPTLHETRLEDPSFRRKPQNVFVCSMADLFGDWVPDEWIERVFKACAAAPQHRYMFLTKNPKRLERTRGANNYWFGTTIVNTAGFVTPGPADALYSAHRKNTFISLEPLQARIIGIGLTNIRCFKWIIIGAETGNRKDKVIPKREWIMDIKDACRAANVPVFMKDSLKRLLNGEFVQEYPW
jgi:protein gp37